MTEAARILLVDDTPANLHVLMELLEPAGYTVLAARSGAQALRIAAKAQPQLVLLDVNMPEMDGYETCRRLRAEPGTAAIPVVFISADPSAEAVAAAREAGGVDYIAKPFRQDEVLEKVRAHLG